MKKLICELCGGNDFTRGDDGLFACGYCRTKYTAEQAKTLMVEGTVRLDRSGESDNLVTLATEALASGNHQEAFDFSNRALEIDPKNSVAWYVKGSAAGWLSNLKGLRLVEMINAFKTSTQFAADDKRDGLKKEYSTALNAVCVACSNISLRHADKYASVDGTWEEHVARCWQIINALKVSYTWHPVRKPLDNIVTVASNLIVGAEYEYWDSTWNTKRKGVRQLSEADKQKMRALIDSVAKDIQKIDPTFVAPTPQTKSACFVVTATTGSELSISVITLREFRDVILSKYLVGRRFIGWYYTHGPRMASYIKSSGALRFLSMILIVGPGTLIACLSLRLRRIFRRDRVGSNRVKKNKWGPG